MSSKKRKKNPNTISTYHTSSNSIRQASSGAARDRKKARVIEVHAKRDGRLGQVQRFEPLDDTGPSAAGPSCNHDHDAEGDAPAYEEQLDKEPVPERMDGGADGEEDEATVKVKRQRVRSSLPFFTCSIMVY